MKSSKLRYFKLAIASLITITSADIQAQNGYPFVSHYSVSEAVDNENFDLIQDKDQNILIANRKGILIFDSRTWDFVPLPYYPVVFAKSPTEGDIYVGCRNGFGWLKKDVSGKYTYLELSDTLFTGTISDIKITTGTQYFVTKNQVFFKHPGADEIGTWDFSSESQLKGSFVFNDEFYFLSGNALYKTETASDTFKLLLSNPFPGSTEFIFTTVTETGEIIIGTNNNELYLFNGYHFEPVQIKDAEYLKTSIITCGTSLSGSKLAIGTLMGGVLITDYKTGLKSSILNYKTGLPDDEIFTIDVDKNNGLWICHTYGLSRSDNLLSVSNLTWYPGLSGNLTHSAWFNGHLYVGTGDGLYELGEKREYQEKTVYQKKAVEPAKTEVSKPVVAESKPVETTKSSTPETRKEQRKKKRETKTASTETTPVQKFGILNKILGTVETTAKVFEKKPEGIEYTLAKKKVYELQSISHSFEKIKGITGKCNEIVVLKDQILVSTNNGLYQVRNNEATAVLPETYINFINSGPENKVILTGSGRSLFILRYSNNRWEKAAEFRDLKYPVYSASMTTPGSIWIGSDNSIHKITLNQNYTIELDDEFPIETDFPEKIILRNINGKLYSFLSSGIFQMEGDSIVAIKKFDNLSTLPDYYFSGSNVVWYHSSGKWDFIADSSAAVKLPSEYLNVFENVQDIHLSNNGDYYIIDENRQIFRISQNAEIPESVDFRLYFSGIKGKNDQTFQLEKPKISYKNSAIRIEFSAPYFLAPGKTEFSYRIIGLNDEWSQWDENPEIDFPVIPPGTYSIEAKARNVFGNETDISYMQIQIKPPFYRTIVFYIIVAILILVGFVLIVKIREESLRKAKLILEQKVRERTAEIERQKNEIEEQKKEITDSIFYAKRIQTAILPSTQIISTVLPDNFVLFLPRDIVSGDFYWSTLKDDKIVFLAADCTGHGVPGAFMSMLGVSFLNEIVGSKKLTDAGSILNELRDHVKSTLAQSGGAEHARDGMDIAMCIIDPKGMKLQFAGAYNPLYMIRNGELSEIKADKMPIGWYEVDAGFKTNEVKIKKGDCFYIFSDGYTDQFGGKLGKKLLAKAFKELLLKIHMNPMPQQKDQLYSEFEKWKGDLQQVDDVLVAGFRI